MSFDIFRHSRKKTFGPFRILVAVIIAPIFTVTAQVDDKQQLETSVIFEIQQANPSSFDNLAYAGNGTKVTASSSFSENYAKHPAAAINDGVYGNSHSWICDIGDKAPSFTIDLGKLATLGVFKFGRDREGKYKDRGIRKFSIAVSKDDNEYTDVYSCQDISALPGYDPRKTAVVIIKGVECRYIKVNVANGVCIDEFEVYAPQFQKNGVNKIEPKLTVVTSRPNVNLFTQSELILLTFTVTGLPAGEKQQLKLQYADEFDKVRATKSVDIEADADGRWSGTVEGLNDRLGFYKVFAALSNGVNLAAAGSRPSGFLIYAVTPDPHARPNIPQSECFFGMQGGYNFNTPGTDIVMPFLGIRWHNGTKIRWKFLEPTGRAGEFEKNVEQARSETIHHYFTPFFPFNRTRTFDIAGKKLEWNAYQIYYFGNPPDWAIKPGSRSQIPENGVLTLDGEKAFAEYCRKIAACFKDEGRANESHYYEVTWEPNVPWGWKGTPAELVRVFQIAYQELHAVDPKAVVAGPTLALSPSTYDEMLALFHKGLPKYIDILDIHPYSLETPEKQRLVERMRELRTLARQQSGRELPIISTECGLLTMPRTTEGWLRQARHNIRENLILLGEKFSLNHSFFLHDGKTGSMGYFVYLTETDKWSYNTEPIAPKPVAAAYAAMTFLLEGYKSVSDITWMGNTALGYAYHRNGDVILALWDWSGTPRKVNVPTGVAQIQLFDWMGNSRAVTCPDGSIELTLTEEPVYLKGVSAKLWGPDAAKLLKVKLSPERIFPGDMVQMEVTARSPDDKAFNGDLKMGANPSLCMTASSRPLAIAAGKTEKQNFKVTVPATLTCGTYPVTFTMTGAKGSVAAEYVSMRVREPLVIEKIAPTLVKGQKGLRISLTEERGMASTGKISVMVKDNPNSKIEQAFSLKANKKQEIIAFLPELNIAPINICPMELGLQTDDGYAIAAATKVNYLIAKHATENADSADEKMWAEVPGVKIAGQAFLGGGKENYRGDQDVSAEVRFAWNSKGLLVYCDVTDDAFFQEMDIDKAWAQDSIQLAFNLDPEKAGLGINTEAVGLMRASEFIIAKTKIGDKAIRSWSAEKRYLPPGPVPTEELSLHITVKEKHLLYTMRIPWSAMGGATQVPGSGDSLTTAMLINDMDPGKKGTRAQLQMFGGIGEGKFPESYGWLILGE
ncbi:MAG: discoidin domain-containing protein [Lentisphaerota bacterium]